MQLITGTEEFRLCRECAAAIGKFDGLHRGHKQLLQEILNCREQGLIAAVFTFDPPPAVFFGRKLQGRKAEESAIEKELSTREEKRRLMAAMGVEVLIEYPLHAETAAMEPEVFIRDILVGRMRTKVIAAGTDVSFGRQGKGNRKLLEKLQNKYDYRVSIIDKIEENGREISSTYIREAVECGDMELADKLLGEPYSIIGSVVHGRKFGRTIGMPTVNLLPEPGKQLPPNGVYYSTVKWKQEVLRGITNIGCKPTVNDETRIGVETYLYDFSGNIYGEELKVSLLHYTRPEQKFAGVEQLRKQLQKDIAQGGKYHERLSEQGR